MDKIHQLKLFCLVAEKRSFAEVALHLGLPRSNVSHAIKRLEKEYEVLLFYRTTRKVTLTHEGHLFYLEAMQLITQLNELNRFKSQVGMKYGKIRIGVAKRIATTILLPNLQQYFQKYPDVKVFLNSQDHYSHLIEQGLDCVVRVGSIQSDLLLARRIAQTKLITLVSNQYIQDHGMPYNEAQLSEHFIVEYRPEKKMSHLGYIYFNNKKISINYKILVEDTTSYVKAGIAGLGMIQIPEFDANDLIKFHHMIPILNHIEPCLLPVHILMTDRQYRPDYLNDFIDWLEQLLKSKMDLKEWDNPATNNQHDS